MANLNEMFKNAGAKKADTPQHPSRVTKWLHYSKLTDNTAQYCNEKDEEEIIALADIIDADKMVLQNLLVRKTGPDEFEIIAGHKRRRACRYLVEEMGKQEYAFLPCTVEDINSVRAEFQLYSSNSHHVKTDYEMMHELERMKYLLENYPEEFPNLQTGRMVERLARQMNMTKTGVGEYLTISKNLGEKGMEAFADGRLKKSAALELSSLPKEEQESLIDQEVIALKDIRQYKEAQKPEQPSVEIDPADPEDESLPGQYRIANTDMDLEEDVPESGTQDSKEKQLEGIGGEEALAQEPLSAYGTPKRQYPPDSLLTTPGCEGGHDCFLCAMSCEIRQDGRWCREAPCGNPFPCETMATWGSETLEEEVGRSCQFVDLDLADHRPGNNGADPCCKECEQKDCNFRCSRAVEKDQKDSAAAEQDVESKAVPVDTEEIPDTPPTTEHKDVSVTPKAVEEEENGEQYPPDFFLQEQSHKLDRMIYAKKHGEHVPQLPLERQKTIVAALANMVTELQLTETKKEAETIQPELPVLRNDKERKEWLRDYKNWGVWYTDDHIGATYYKYDFPNGTRLIAETYDTHTSCFMHLVGGPKERPKGSYGIPKYPYHKSYRKHEDSETELVEFLKDIQKKGNG